MENNESINTGLFINTTYDIDVIKSSEFDVKSDDFKELLVRLYQYLNSMCNAINLKDSAYYIPEEFINSQSFFPNPMEEVTSLRQVYRIVVNIGTLPNNTTLSVGHGIDSVDGNYSFTRIYGAASDPINLLYIPLPYSTSSGTNNIQLQINNQNVLITTTGNYSTYTISYVVLEYLKN